MRERVAATLILVSLLATASAVFWYRQSREPSVWQPGDRVITLTGYAACGVWTTEEVNGLNYWWKEFKPAVINNNTKFHANTLRSSPLGLLNVLDFYQNKCWMVLTLTGQILIKSY